MGGQGPGDRRGDWYYIEGAQGGTGGWDLYSGETGGQVYGETVGMSVGTWPGNKCGEKVDRRRGTMHAYRHRGMRGQVGETRGII